MINYDICIYTSFSGSSAEMNVTFEIAGRNDIVERRIAKTAVQHYIVYGRKRYFNQKSIRTQCLFKETKK